MLKQHYRLTYLLSLVIVIMLSLGLSGCGGSPDTEPDTAGKPIVNLVARPTGTEVAPGQQVAIAAEVMSNSEIQSIRWTAKDGGELSVDEGQSVIYKVPDTPGKYNVDVLVTNEDGSTTDTVTFEVPTPMVAAVAATSIEDPTPTDTPRPTATTTKEPTAAPTGTNPPVSSDAVAKAIRIDTPPIIDGRLDDQVWSLAEPLTYAEHPSGNDSTTAVARLLWDDQYLYASFDVSDTQIERSSAKTPFDGDSVSVVLDNGGQLREYRYSLTGENSADKKGDADSKHFLKGATSFDDSANLDEGYSVEMQIPWGANLPVANSKINADFLSVDHDGNPGGMYDATDTVFSKISWDGDGSVDTAGRSILLVGGPLPLAEPVITSITPKPEDCPIDDDCTTIVTVNWEETDSLKLYILVHPNPEDPNQSYWVQTLPRDRETDQWISSDVLIGQPGDEPGLPFEICAVATEQSLYRNQELGTPPAGPISCIEVTRGRSAPTDLVTLTSPQDSQLVDCGILAKGTYSPDITDPIWPVVYVGNRYHPQDEAGQAPPMVNGRWFGTVRFGDCTKPPEHDKGKAFQLIIVTAGEQCNQAFEDYLTDGRALGFPGMLSLPDDCQEHVRIVVERK